MRIQCEHLLLEYTQRINKYVNCYSLQGEYCSELMPPTPPPRRIRLGQGDGCMPASPVQAQTQPVRQTQPSFSRIASGLKLAQAQAMAVAGFLPEPQHWPSLIIEADANGDSGRHAHCSLLNHRASFHGRGQPQ